MSESEGTEYMVKQLIAKGASVSVCNTDGNTALHLEAMHCDPDASWPSAAGQAMIEKDSALVNAKNAQGKIAADIFDEGENDSVQKKTIEPRYGSGASDKVETSKVDTSKVDVDATRRAGI